MIYIEWDKDCDTWIVYDCDIDQDTNKDSDIDWNTYIL